MPYAGRRTVGTRGSDVPAEREDTLHLCGGVGLLVDGEVMCDELVALGLLSAHDCARVARIRQPDVIAAD
eukprot:scaffold105678_cov32-Tisochrysis_lutea.AAC.2